MEAGSVRRRRPVGLLGAAALAATAFVGVLTLNPAAATAATPVLTKKIIGYSVRHRPIVAYHLGNPALKSTSLILGQMHGDEHAGVTVANSIIHGTQSIEHLTLWVIPTMNPDGDAAHTRQNAHKVDLNRNWPDNWAHLTGEYYSGTKPLSEPETRAMYRFLKWLHPHYIVSLHQPLDGVDTTDGGALEKSFATSLAQKLHLPKKALRCWSVCHGSMTGWYTTKRMGIGETVEFGAHPSHAYLVGTARRGIVAALHGSFGTLSRHNPRFRVTPHGGTRQVRFTGWAYDVDNRAARLTYRIYEKGRLLAKRVANASAPGNVSRHTLSLTLKATPGRHTYCAFVANVGSGTGNPHTCSKVVVAGS